MDGITYTPVPTICKGYITSQIKDTETYEVSIYSSPLGRFSAPIYASVMYQPGLNNNFKQGDYVYVQVMFNWGSNGKYQGAHPGTANYILGIFNERSVANIKVENPLTLTDNDRVVLKNKTSQAGISASDSGEVNIASGAIHILLKAFGHGVYENSNQVMAQNHHRIIANAPPYLSREHFGMFAGNTDNDKIAKTSDDDYYLNYRRFITKTLSPDNWVSTCEGAFNPWVGANNNADFVSPSKEVLLSKIINHGTSRVTIEMGEPGDSFVNLRVDDIPVCEKSITNNATPAVVGNKFNLKVSDKGAVELTAAGQGPAPLANFKLMISAAGELTIQASKKITITHGDSDTAANSIVMDPAAGIDITAKMGFRVNGTPVVNKKYLDWMAKYQSSFCQTVAIGSPAPISPIALPEFTSGSNAPASSGGFTTSDVGQVATGITNVVDAFSSV